jgi:hypothetical protein
VAYFRALSTTDSAWGKASGTVDASADTVMAWLWLFTSYERARSHVKNEGSRSAVRRNVDVPGSRSALQVAAFGMGAAADRIFASWWCWRREPAPPGSSVGDLVISLAPVCSYSDRRDVADEFERTVETHRAASGAVLGEVVACYRISPLAPNVCRVTLVTQGSLKGFIPELVLQKKLKSTLSLVNEVRDRFERRGKDEDAELRAVFPRPPALGELASDQRELVGRCCELDSETENHAWQRLQSDGHVAMHYQMLTAYSFKGKVTLTLDCPASEALAWCFMWTSRERMRVGNESNDPGESSPRSASEAGVKGRLAAAAHR